MPKKKVLPALPNKIVIIKNEDKDKKWNETWAVPANRSPGHFPHPSRICLVGSPGLGKTNIMKNLFLKHQTSDNPFKRLYVMCADLTSKEWVNLEPTILSDEVIELDEYDAEIKTCLIIDDFEFKNNDKHTETVLTTIMRFCSTHKNLSVYLSYQSFFHIPSICRKMSNVFVVYKPVGKDETATICNRVGLKKGHLGMLFKQFCTSVHDNICIDLTKDTPYPLRKNIYQIIQSDNSDSDDDGDGGGA